MLDFITLCRAESFPMLESGHHHCVEGWVQTHCPFCGDGSHGWHLGFSIEHGNMNCWKCGKHTAWEWLKAILPPGAGSRVGMLLKKYKSNVQIIATKKIVTRGRNAKAPIGLKELSKKHKAYLYNRNFDSDYLESEWGLKGSKHLSMDWNWRIVAPIRDIDNRIVAYTGRTLSSSVKPRWKMTKDSEMSTDPKKLIYGIEKVNPDKGVLIVEGPSDVWRMGPGAVGLLGIDWQVEQAGLLRQFKRRFILFDNQDVAQKRAEELGRWFAGLPGETEIITGIKSDPGDLNPAEADNIMKELGLK